ncbi:MAG TPA: PHB depolymerase family esterase [Rhizomicrobium sp.]|jgi:predicted esterase|nr:PHB depolymerase family esterase [Rhizomicrobium sp.]
MKLTRRSFGRAASALAASIMARAQTPPDAAPNRLTATPAAGGSDLKSGMLPLGFRTERDALLYVPESSLKLDKAALVISLHGASRSSDRGIEVLRAQADEFGFLLLAPASSRVTWDIINGAGGLDAKFINRAMARVYEMRTIDPARVAMAGFSDGASASLSLGLANGDLFAAVFGFSPGFIVDLPRAGKPSVFISHGTIDNVLPIDECSRRIVPQLRQQGYQVTYREFEGKHTLPPEIASEAMRWFMGLHA